MKLKVKMLAVAILMALPFIVRAEAQNGVIITNDGEQIQAYNLDYSSADFCYYTNSPESDDMKRIKKADVLIIKLDDGRKVDPCAVNSSTSQAVNTNGGSSAGNTGVGASGQPGGKPWQHDPVTHKCTSAFSPGREFSVCDDRGQELTMKVLSTASKTLTVTKPRKDLEYELAQYVIPEYVDIDGEIYTVTAIDESAFKNIGFWSNDMNIRSIQLPMTLKEIGDWAFAGREGMGDIIIPDSVERIGERAFFCCGRRSGIFGQLYIPETVKYVGDEAFRGVGTSQSFRGYFQGNLTSLPPFIVTGNCTDYGIDEEAVEAYMRRKR